MSQEKATVEEALMNLLIGVGELSLKSWATEIHGTVSLAHGMHVNVDLLAKLQVATKEEGQ